MKCGLKEQIIRNEGSANWILHIN